MFILNMCNNYKYEKENFLYRLNSKMDIPPSSKEYSIK